MTSDISQRDLMAEASRKSQQFSSNTDGVSHRSGRSKRYLAVGKLGGRRGYIIAIRAFALGGKLGDRLTLVGFGRHRRRLERWTKALGVDAVVMFSDAALGEHLDLGVFDVVLLMSYENGYLSALIATAVMHGLKVIAPENHTGLGDGLVDSFPIYRAASYDTVAYSHAIASISAGR